MKKKLLSVLLILTLVLSNLIPVTTFGSNNDSPFDIDFDDMEAGAFNASKESKAIQLWANNISAANPVVVSENENNYLRIDGTAVTQKVTGMYPINWNVDLSADRYSEIGFRFRVSDLSRSEDTAKQPYFDLSADYKDISNDTHIFPKIFGISDDGKSIIAFDGENRIYQDGEQVKRYQALYTAETSMADMWLDVKMVQDFEAGTLTCTITDEDGEVLTSFVQEFGTVIKNSKLHNIHFSMPMIVNDTTYRKMKVDFDDIYYRVLTAEDVGMIPAEECKSELYVSLDGSDENDGTKEDPFATLEKARDTIRIYEELPKGGVTVYIRGGNYNVTQTFSLNGKDSGTEKSPIVYRAYPGEKVVFNGGKQMSLERFEPVSGEMKEFLISEDAKKNVLVADLSDFGIDNIERYSITNYHSVIESPFIIYDGVPMTLSQWPNSTELADWPIAHGLRNGYVERDKAGEGTFLVEYFTNRPDLWSYNNLEDVMAMGFWVWDWYCEAQYVNIDRVEKTLEAQESSMYGVIGPNWVTKDRGFYFLNVYEELDTPGEYYIDRKNNKIYLYPATNAKNPEISMTWSDFSFVRLNGASNVTFEGITFTSGKQIAFSVSSGENVVIDRCNFNLFDKKAVEMKGVTSSGIKNSEFYYLGQGAVELTSGDLTTLDSGNSFFTNNLAHDFSLLKQVNGHALTLKGVGNLVDHNEFYNCPHIVIRFQGADNIMEYNVFHDVATNTADTGAIYNGRTLADIDNVIRYNHFYNVGAQNDLNFTAHAIFPDDGCSELDIYGNIFGEGLSHVTAIKAHGGMNVDVTNNLFIDCEEAYSVCDWPVEKWQEQLVQGQSYFPNFNLTQTEPYTSRYPWLANLGDGGQNLVVESHTFENNVVMYLHENPENWISTWGKGLKVEDLRGLDNNLILQKNINNTNEFVDYESGDLTLKSDSVIFSKLPDFQPIPFSKIGRIFASTEIANAQIDKVQEVLNQAATGNGLGQYPQSSVDALKSAIAVAKQACAEAKNENDLTRAVKDLNKAKDVFEASVIRSVMVDGQGTVSVPIGFTDAQIHAGELTGDVLLEINGGQSDGITIDGTIDGKKVTVEISDKTAIADGTFLGMGLPSQEQRDAVLGDIYQSVLVGNETEYETPIRIVLEGAAGQEATLMQGDTLHTAVKLKEDSADALGENNLGVYTSGDDLIVYTTLGGVLYAYLPLEVSDVLKLKSISLDGTPLSGFSPNVAQYTKVVTGNAVPVVSAEASHERAQVEIKQATTIPGNAVIIVTAFGTDKKKLYTISFKTAEEGTGTGGMTPPSIGGGSTIGGGTISVGGGGNSGKTEETVKVKFTDTIGHWAEANINEMADKGIVSGVSDTTFEPDRSITRAEFAALMARALKLTAANDDGVFADVSSDAWYKDAVSAAAAAGLIVGYDGNFRPNDTITREEMAVVIMKAYQFLGKAPLKGKLSRFADKDVISAWAVDYVDGAVSSGLISGMTSDTFAPKENATRAQVASLIKRLLNK